MANEYKQYVQFVVLDIEEDTEQYASRMGAKPDWTKCVIAFMERVKECGYTPVLYCNQNWLINKLNYDKVKQYKIWYAAVNVDSPKYNPAIWQYSWEGKVNGINGNVDMNYLYDNTLLTSNTHTKTVTAIPTVEDKTKFLNNARSYIGKNGDFVCNTKLHLNMIVDWCAFSVSAIMNDCGFIGKYIRQIEGGAGSIPRASDGVYGKWFKKGTESPQSGDLFFLRYADYPQQDRYFCDHVGIVESVDGSTFTTLEGNVDGEYGNWQRTSSFKRKTRYLNNDTVYAFYRPYWQVAKTTTTSSNNSNPEIYQIESSVKVNFKTMVTVTDGVNIRQGAGTNYKVLGSIPYKNVVEITNRTSGGKYHWGLTTYNGVKGWIALEFTTQIETDIKKGDRVKVKNGATVYGTSIALDTFVYKTTYQVMEVVANRAVIGINGQVTTAIDTKYLTKV